MDTDIRQVLERVLANPENQRQIAQLVADLFLREQVAEERGKISLMTSETPIEKHLKSMGFSSKYRGYRYIRVGLEIALEDESVLDAISKGLYLEIAKSCKVDGVSRVEGAIRYAIKKAWETPNTKLWWSLYFRHGEPNSSEFFRTMCGVLRRELK